jgi:hypothetical protein
MQEEESIEEKNDVDLSLRNDKDLIDYDFQINQIISRVKASSKTISLFVPEVEEKEVYVILTDEQGKPLLKNNKFVCEKKIVPVFKNWSVQEVDLPLNELFQEDLVLSNLSERDREIINTIYRLSSRLIVSMIQNKKDYSRLLWFLYSRALTYAETSRALKGRTLTLTKTSIREINSRSEKLSSQREEKKGFFGFFKKKEKND